MSIAKGAVNIPRAFIRTLCNGIGPLPDTPFFTAVNFLAVSDKPKDGTPLGNPLSEINKHLRFRVEGWILVRIADLLCVPSSLCFVKHEEVLGRDAVSGGVVFDVVSHPSD